MRISKTYRTRGACCCLVPFLILLAIIVAAIVGSAVVWHAAMPGTLRWQSEHHYRDAYHDGYRQGKRAGTASARRGDQAPADLDALARSEAERSHINRDRDRWIEGFRDGFSQGFGNSGNEASNGMADGLQFATARACPH